MGLDSLIFFSILIPTFNRHDKVDRLICFLNDNLLRLENDIEILVGNDNPDYHYVSPIDSDNICVINNDVNLGEGGNLNKLLHHAKGSFILYVFDDESIDSSTLKSLIGFLRINCSVDCVLLDSRPGKLYESNSCASPLELIPVNRYEYLSKNHYKRRVGFMNVYNKSRLIELGGIEVFTKYPIAVCSEYMLNVKVATFESIYIAKPPCIIINFNYDSFSVSNVNFTPYLHAYKPFIESLSLFTEEYLNNRCYYVVEFYSSDMAKRLGILIGRKYKSSYYLNFRLLLLQLYDSIVVLSSSQSPKSYHSLFFGILIGLIPEFFRKIRHM